MITAAAASHQKLCPATAAQGPAAQGAASWITIALVVHLAQLHVVVMALSVPAMICLPHGCLFTAGNLRMVSDGFQANSAFATALWGSGIVWLTAVRYLGIACTRLRYASVANVSVVISTYTAFLTLRYDTFEEFHVAFATAWIVSSFVTQYCVTMRPEAHPLPFTQYLFWAGVLCGGTFVVLYATVVAHEMSAPGGGDEHKRSGDSVHLLSTISLLEVITVFSLFALDFTLSMQVLRTYVGGVGVLQLADDVQQTTHRVVLKTVFFAGHVALGLYGVLWASKELG
jgi:hypothetical protein